MKTKKRVFVFMALAALLVMLPGAALAGKAQLFDVTVRNRTGQPAEVKVIGADGVPHMFTAPVGVGNITLPEGVQSYWVSSSCGNSAGSWNLNVNKTLWIDCSPLGNAVWVAKPQKLEVCADSGVFLFMGDEVVFYSKTYWDFPFSTYDANLNYLLGTGFSVLEGCVDDLAYTLYRTYQDLP